MNAVDLSRFSPKWQFRFNFFQQHGAPKEPRFKEAWKALSFGDRLKININFFAFFFGFIYLFILGMWRKALVVIGIGLVLGIVSLFLPDIIARPASRSTATACMFIAQSSAPTPAPALRRACSWRATASASPCGTCSSRASASACALPSRSLACSFSLACCRAAAPVRASPSRACGRSPSSASTAWRCG